MRIVEQAPTVGVLLYISWRQMKLIEFFATKCNCSEKQEFTGIDKK